MNFITKIISAIAGIFSLWGCATNNDLQIQLNQKPLTHSNFSNISSVDLEPMKEVEFELTDTSPIYLFDSGKSYFKTFSLPELAP